MPEETTDPPVPLLQRFRTPPVPIAPPAALAVPAPIETPCCRRRPPAARRAGGRDQDAAWFRSPYGSQVAFDSRSGAWLSTHDLRQDGLWAQVEDAFEPLHFGNFGGLASKVPWSAAGLAPALLCLSGMTIWWKRRRTPAR